MRWWKIQNAGKLFEKDFKESVPDTCWIYRLRDNASSFANGDNTRFTSSNICDFILFDDNSKNLFLLECKSTKSTSIPLTMLRENQIKGLLDANKHNLIAGLLLNFRNENNDTFFISIDRFIEMINKLGKKSLNVKDLENNNAVKIDNHKKRTRYKYDIYKLMGDLCSDWSWNIKLFIKAKF